MDYFTHPSGHNLLGIINKIEKEIDFKTLCLPLFLLYSIIYNFLNFDRFILILNCIYERKDFYINSYHRKI